MTASTMLSSAAQNINWLLTSFSDTDPTVDQAIAVSSDGLLMAASRQADRAATDRLAAVVSGMCSLADGGARVMGKGGVNQVILEMDHGYLFISAIGSGSVLAAVTTKNADLAGIGYEMALLIEKVGPSLTPEIVAELKNGMVG
ncbi:MAG: roadblock/LC7 domain-containing protein [Angustibacter sp.]